MTHKDYSGLDLRWLAQVHPRLALAVPCIDADTGTPVDLYTVYAGILFNVAERNVTTKMRDEAKRAFTMLAYRSGNQAQNTRGPNTGRQNHAPQQAAQQAWYHQYNTANRWRK